MLKMNTGAWIGIIAGIVGFLTGLIAVIFTAGSEAYFVAPLMVIMFGGMLWLFYKLFFRQMILASRLQKTGLPGTARILEVLDTGVTINNHPQVKLIVEVKNNLGQVYNSTIRSLVSRLNPGMFQPGMTIPVKIDPKNEQNIIIDYSGGTRTTGFAQPGMDATALKAEIEKWEQESEVIRTTGKPARAIVKNYRWLGAYVNGNNPYAELELEILPENASSFTAKTKGVIGEAAVPKYQPGKEIYVKYDFYDNSKVAIDHS